jgi:hypothetical protein
MEEINQKMVQRKFKSQKQKTKQIFPDTYQIETATDYMDTLYMPKQFSLRHYLLQEYKSYTLTEKLYKTLITRIAYLSSHHNECVNSFLSYS